MSSLQRNAHVTGLNNPFADQYPAASSCFRPVGGGAPGILAGLTEGFSVAIGLRLPALRAGDLWAEFDAASDLGAPPYAHLVPDLELLVGTLSNNLADGWGLSWDSDLLFSVGDGDALITTTELNGMLDVMVLASYVGDDTPYGGGGSRSLGTGYNGMAGASSLATTFTPDQEFVLGGSVATGIEPIASGGTIAGAFHSAINSFWMTAGIPNIQQASAFFEQSMQAGQVIPQAWAPVRTVANPDPDAPESPTGHHWTASDLDLSQGIGGTWTDRISGVVLERVGTENTDTRELAKGHNYFATA